jgi:hypothetical protein
MPLSRSAFPVARPRATVVGTFGEGWRRVLAAPALTAGIALMTLAAAVPLAMAVNTALSAQLGSSMVADRLLEGWDVHWAGEFAAEARGLATSVTHEILGFGGTIATVSGVLDGTTPHPLVATAAAVYVALWVFLSGGILDRLARARPIRTAAFFSACGAYFARFLRLAVVIGVCYWAIFRWLHPLLFETLWNRWTRDLTSESTALLLRAALYLVLLAALAAVNVIADFAKVRAVVEDRRSMLGALGASLRFVRRRVWRVAGLYFVNLGAVLGLAAVWLLVDPRATWDAWIAFAAGQLYIVARIAAKLAFMGSEVVFFQQELAHAHYTAAPEPTWPDSPAVESIRENRH